MMRRMTGMAVGLLGVVLSLSAQHSADFASDFAIAALPAAAFQPSQFVPVAPFPDAMALPSFALPRQTRIAATAPSAVPPDDEVTLQNDSEGAPEFRLERREVAAGADLLTVFATVPGKGEVPMLSLLRDTLGDRDVSNDRLRYVWLLTSTSPNLLKRIAAAVPFFYHRAAANAPKAKRAATANSKDGSPPPALLDLGDTSRHVWSSLAQQITQVAAIDGNGTWIRASTRRYRNNVADRRQVQLIEGLSVISQIEDLPEVRTILSEPELLELQARLSLAGQTLGGLVTAEKLPDAYFKQREQTEETRGHNWELLRQRAEANGLYFDPMGLGRSSTHAIVWVARRDLARGSAERLAADFDGKFLNFANPFADPRVRDWSGVTITRYYDSDGYAVEAGTPGAHTRELIPLGLYSLDYPKVPLLLVDFRDALAPKRREMILRATTDTLTGVLGISKWGNWPYMAGAWGWNFWRSRHGEAANRNERLRAYSAVRRWLALDHSLEPSLRVELQRRLEVLGVNPLEDSIFAESEIADQQYLRLLRYATDPEGLGADLRKDREAELTGYHHGPMARAGFTAARVVTLGIFRHREPVAAAPERREEFVVGLLDRQRRAEREVRFLEAVARSGARPEIAWDMDQVKEALGFLSTQGLPLKSAAAVEQIMARTTDQETRALCERVLDSLHGTSE